MPAEYPSSEEEIPEDFDPRLLIGQHRNQPSGTSLATQAHGAFGRHEPAHR